MIYSSIILLLLVNHTSITIINLNFDDNTDSYILISKTGKICLKESNNDIIWEKKLDRPLITTNINVNSIDFNQLNVLPGDEGRLYAINSNQDTFHILNITMKDIVLNSPTTLAWIDTKVFLGTMKKTRLYINMKNGLITPDGNRFILNSQTNDLEFSNKQFVILRTDYMVELKNSLKENEIEWNATVSQLEVTSMDNKLQYSKDSLTPLDWNILELNQKEYQYIYKYEHSTKLFIKMSSDDHHNSNNNEFNKDGYDLPHLIHNNDENIILASTEYNIIIILISLFIFILISLQIRRRAAMKRHLLNVTVNNIMQVDEVHPELNIGNKAMSNKNKVKDNKSKDEEIENDDSFSQLSTKSVMNKSIDEMHRRFSQSFCPQISLSLSLIHRDSAPVDYDDSKKINKIESENEGKAIETQSSNGNDEELSPHKAYYMKIIDKPHAIDKPKSAPPLQMNQYPNKNNKASPPISFRKTSETLLMRKKKYKPTQEEQTKLQMQIDEYLEYISSANNNDEYLYQSKHCNSVNCKYEQIYKIINESINEDHEGSQSNSFRNNNLNKNHINISYDFKGNNSNLSLFDRGRFINTFDNIQLIGKGGFGSVFKAVHKIDGSYYAIKVIKFFIELNEDLAKINEVKEIKTMMKLDCSNIVRYITCWFEFEDNNLMNKRGRSLSMDGKKEESIESQKKKRSSLLLTQNKLCPAAFQSHNSEFELVINETSNSFIDNEEINYFKPNFNSKTNNNNCEDVAFSFEDHNSQYDNIIFTNSNYDDDDDDSNKENDNSKKLFHHYDNITKHSDNNIQRHSHRKKTEKMMFPVYFFMQMEYCEGFSLSYYLQIQKEALPEKTIIHFFNQLINAVKVIHSQHIIHRDLKPDNIFIKPNFKIKIGDFGLAAEMNQYSSKEIVGTFLYQSPEQIAGKAYNEKVDIYALGIILLEMCLFFPTDSERRCVLMNIKKSIYPDELKLYPNENSLIKLMTNSNPANRPNIISVIDSTLMLELLDQLS